MRSNFVIYEHKTQDVAFQDERNGRSPLGCSPHLHREIELVYFLEGETVAYADSVRCVLRPGDVYVAFPNQIHYFETPKPEKYFLFVLKPELIPEFLELFTTGTPRSPVIRGADKLPRVEVLFRMLADVCTNRATPYSDAQVRGYLLALFSELLPRMSVSKVSAGDSGALRAIVSYCTRNFADDLSLSHLEEQLHLNKYYISHLFSNRLGIRFNDYINSLRISEACRYLLNSDLSITEISETVGFNTLRTFNRAFTKQLGRSPSEYRKSELDPVRDLGSPLR